MAATTREQAMIALFNLLTSAYSFNYTSRRPITASGLATLSMPALLLIDDDEEHVKGKYVTPAIRTLSCAAWIFISTGQDVSITPATLLNNIIDLIDPVSNGVLKPGPNGRQTLGNLVTDCYIEGKVQKDPGVQGGIGFAHVPMKIIFMNP